MLITAGNPVVLIYAILFMDWDPQDNPVEEVSIPFPPVPLLHVMNDSSY